MAHKKSGGSSANGRDSIGRRLGLKKSGGQSVIATSAETGYGKDKVLAKLQAVIDVYNDDFFAEEESEEEENE